MEGEFLNRSYDFKVKAFWVMLLCFGRNIC